MLKITVCALLAMILSSFTLGCNVYVIPVCHTQVNPSGDIGAIQPNEGFGIKGELKPQRNPYVDPPIIKVEKAEAFQIIPDIEINIPLSAPDQLVSVVSH